MQINQSVKEDSPSSYQLAAFFLLLGVFMNLLDATIVIIALPSIQVGLDASFSALHWVMAIYVLAFASGLLPFGRLGDVVGRRWVFIWGLSSFTIASAVCGFAPSIETLILARFFQGIGGAMMTPQVLAIIHANFPKEQKSRAIGAFGVVSGIAAASGPLIGGMLIALNVLDLGWRLVFLINVPIGVFAIFGSVKLLPHDRMKTGGQIDWLGSFLFACIILLFTYPLIEAEQIGWSAWFWLMLAGAVILTTVFWYWQHYLFSKKRLQTLPVPLIHNGEFLRSIAFLTLQFAGIAGVVVVFAVTLQNGLNISPAFAGGVLAVHPLGAMLAAMATGKLGNRWLPGRIFFGVLMLFCGMILLKLSIGINAAARTLIPALLIIGFGIGASTMALFQYVLMQVAQSEAGAGSGAMQTFQQVGILIGISVVGQIFFSSINPEHDTTSYIVSMQTALNLPIGIFAVLSLLALIKIFLGGQKNG